MTFIKIRLWCYKLITMLFAIAIFLTNVTNRFVILLPLLLVSEIVYFERKLNNDNKLL
jgi:hypothetical protein